MADEWRVPGYTEVKELGAGVQGRAVLVRHERSGSPYVIKYLLAADPAAQQRFQEESALLQQISSPYVARWHGHLVDGPRSAILMEAVDGASLRELLTSAGKLAPEASLLVLKGSLLGLQAAHERGIVHRDYKPANVVVRKDGLSKLIDFGVATLAGERSRSGTPLYMAPEQWRREPAGPATDVYAATCVFFECVTGAPPFAGTMQAHLTAPVPLDPVPEPLRDLVSAGLAKSVAARPPTAASFVAELERSAVAAYGPDWEQHGLNLLGGLAGGLATLFLLSPALASATTASAAPTATASSLLTAKTTIAAATSVLVLGGTAAFFVVAEDDPKPRPAPEAFAFVPASVTEQYAQPFRAEIREASYLTVTGGDPTIRARINKALRAPLDAAIAQARKVPPCPGGAQPVWLSAKTAPGFKGPALLTVLYTYEWHNYCAGGGNSVWQESITINPANGDRLTGDTLWSPKTLTPAGLKTLTRRLGPQKGRCVPADPFAHRPLSREEFVPGPELTRISVQLHLTPSGTKIFREPGEGDGCPNFTAALPYDKIRDLLNPTLVSLLTGVS